MFIKSYIQCSNNAERIGLEYPNRCPICGDSIMPIMVQNFKNLKINIYSFLFECPSCGKGFLGHYESSDEEETYQSYRYNLLNCIDVFPKIPKEKDFDNNLERVSPSFCKIYNEALFAEIYGLNEIAGIGYRKALEFLIKDYCIYRNIDDAEKIKKQLLGQVISEFIDSSKILNLSKASVWVGNDETHYIRKFEDKDINDLKRFIEATVAFITYELISDEAEQLVNS